MITHLWTQITEWMRINAPVTFASFAPPATEKELASLAVALGYPVPLDLSELLRLNNGLARDAGVQVPMPGSLGLAGTGDIVDSLASLRRIGEVEDGDPADEDWVWWSYHWIPIAPDYCGGQLVYDVRTGTIARWIEEDGIPSVWWLSLEAMLVDMAARLQGNPPVHLQMKEDGRLAEIGTPVVIDGALEWPG